MKIIKKSLLSILFISFLFSCESNDDAPIDENSILGSWKLTEAFISSGGPQYWVTVDNGYELTFSSNKDFTSTQYDNCDSGVFSINADVTTLSFDYNCSGFTSIAQNQDGFITFTIEEIDKNYFILTPTSGPICIEGCSYKFVRL